ncbi:MAG: DUF72 domain-containing protein [Pseudoxanthomonas sp.]|nr:DUF72 domain-containing protein [Pseudoxanthomonas sp.]
MTAPKPSLRIGCAGWSIPSAQRSLFGEGETALERYATVFNGVEINSSFYRRHGVNTYERWAHSVPRDFLFSVKLPKSISHEARLRGCGSLLDKFMEETAGLGEKLGAILVQLPPSLMFETRAASTFFTMLRRRSAVPVVCEPRHPSWFEPSAEATFESHDISRVAADPPITDLSAAPGEAGPLRYWRWHGSPRMYYSSYSDEALAALANDVRGQLRNRLSGWVVFDNTAHGQATANAMRLKAMLLPAQKGSSDA